MRWILGLLLLVVVLSGATLLVGPGMTEAQLNPVKPHAPYVVSDKAKALHRTLNMADLHADTLLWGRDILVRGTRGHVDVPRLIEGRFAVQVFSTVTKTPRGKNDTQTASDPDQITSLVMLNAWPPATWNSVLQRALYQAGRLERFADASGGTLIQLKGKADLQKLLGLRSKGSNVVGGLLATEGAHPLEGKIENVKRLYDAGFRMVGLQHFFDNELGGSLHGISKGGLTPFGYQAVKAMEELGMIVDVAHSSEKVVADVLQIASKPIVVSHTGVHGICKKPRNISDDLMVAIAAKGGLIGIGYWDGAVCDDTPDGVARAIRYAVDLVGIDHVALGSDYDGTTAVTFDASESAALIDALQRQALSDDDIRKVAGENTIRFLQANLSD